VKPILSLALMAALFEASHARASIRDTTYVLDPVVVTATRTETLRRNLPGSITVVAREELQTTGATGVLDGVAATMPGVFVTQRGVVGFGLGTGAAGQISIRGVGGAPNAQVLVLVDGRPDFVGLFGHPLPDAYALSEVDRVEVLRGPASAVYGTNAMGGVINIITRRKRTPGTTALLRTEAGPWSTYDADAMVIGAIPAGFDYRVSAGHTRTDGHRVQSDFRRTHLDLALGMARGPWDFRIEGSTTPFKGHDPGPDTLAAPPNHWIEVTRSSALGTASYHRGHVSGTVMLHRNWGTHTFYDGWHSHDYTMGVITHASYACENGVTTTFAFDAKQYGGDAVNDTTSVDYGSHSVTEYAPSMTVQVPLGTRLNVTASARAQHHSTYGWFFAPEGGASLHLVPRLTVRGSVSRGFRSPDLRALFLFPASRDTLKPEEVLNVEAGITWRALDWLTADVTAFRMTGDKLIEFRPPPPFPPAFENRGSFTHHGVELETRWWLPRLHGRLFTAWQDVGEQTAGSAKYTIGTTATTTVEKVRLTLDARWVDGLYGSDNHKEKLPSYTLVNATVARPLWRKIEAQIVFRNILDAKYETMTGYPMPGFHVLVGLSARLGAEE